MGDTAPDPIAGETMKNTATKPGMLLVAASVLALVVCLASFAMRQVGVGIGAAIVMLLAAGGALSWLTAEGRRVRQVQRDWSKRHRSVPR